MKDEELTPKLKRKLPKNRTFEQIKRHYEVEKSIAEKLKRANREERKAIFPVMYDELFAKVADHPRLSKRENKEKVLAANRQKLQLVKKYLNDFTVFLEFGSGDCHFASEVCKHVKQVYAVDISDQRGKLFNAAHNFELIVYDGYNLDLEDSSIDVVFSDQLIEHLFPGDIEGHFKLVKRILRDKGLYIFRSPHAFFGPQDISKYFSDEPEGFHLKEWTYSEIEKILKKLNFSSWHGLWRINRKMIKKYVKFPFCYFKTTEAVLKHLSKKPQRIISRGFLPVKMVMIAIK